MLYFEKVDVITKRGKYIKKLKALHKDVNISDVIDFIGSLLPKIIHHRNLLKNYRTNLKIILENINDCIVMGLDFSENLTVPVKQEPQSLHWSKGPENSTLRNYQIEWHNTISSVFLR